METPNLVKGWTSTYQVKAEEIIVVVLSRKFADIYLESGKTIETRHLLHEIQEKWPDCLDVCSSQLCNQSLSCCRVE